MFIIFQLKLAPKQDDEALLKQVPEKYREETRKLLGELNKRNPTLQEKQLLIDILGLMIKKDNTDPGPFFYWMGQIIKNPQYNSEILGIIKSQYQKSETPSNSELVILHTINSILYYLRFFRSDENEILKTTRIIIEHTNEDTHTTLFYFELFLRNQQRFLNPKFLSFIQRTVIENGDKTSSLLKTTHGNSISAIINLPLETNQNIGFYLEKAEIFAKKHEIEYKKDYGETLINIAYALATIGEEKTATLHREFGIVYFSRYTKKTLEELYLNKSGYHHFDRRPVLLTVFNKNDYNGAFYTEGKELEKLTRFYKLLIVETDSEQGFYKAIEKFGQKNRGIDALIIGGHGTSDSLHLGNNIEIGEAAILDLTDEKEMEKRRIRHWMKPNSKVILVSCSTGKDDKSIAAMVSRISGAKKVYAPRFDLSKTSYHLNAKGELVDVTYNVDKSEYKQGAMRIVPRRIH